MYCSFTLKRGFIAKELKFVTLVCFWRLLFFQERFLPRSPSRTRRSTWRFERDSEVYHCGEVR